MATLPLLDKDNTPADSQPLLDQLQQAFGMVPNFHATIAASPQALKAYMTLHQLVTESAFTAEEMTVAWQTINVEHECHYCTPAHAAVAAGMKVDPAISEAVRNKTALPTEKLEALRTFALQVVRNRGNVDAADIEAFKQAGFTDRSIADVLMVLAQKTMSNYLNHMANTPLDEAFKPFE